MNCKKARELILTDYLDEQMEAEPQKSLEDHLSACFHCREFVSVAQKNILKPFMDAEKAHPSDQVWRQIKETIKEGPESAMPDSLTVFLNIFKKYFLFPKSAYALAGILVLILVTIPWTRPMMNKEIKYIEYLVEATEDVSTSQDGGYGTSIEDFFL